MDAVFFIAILGIAVTLLSQAETDGDERNFQDPGEVCAALFESRVNPADFGYGNLKPTMLSDLCAASLTMGDGKIMQYVSGTLNNLYPWQNSVCVILNYNGHTEKTGTVSDEYTRHCETEYDVEYGGKLTVSVYLYA